MLIALVVRCSGLFCSQVVPRFVPDFLRDLLAVVGAATYVFRINLCNAIFGCGCQSLWGNAGAFCNVHTPCMAHCPWCSHGWWGHNIPTGAILVTQAAIFFVPSRLSVPKRILFSIAAFFVVGIAVALLFGLYSGYPSFLGMRIH